MKKILKRINIFSFVLGAIIFGSIGVYATITYTASQIKYTKSNNQEVTLDTALNDLYSTANTTLSEYRNKYDEIDVRVAAEGYSKDYYSFGILRVDGGVASNYSKFKIKDKGAEGTGTCTIFVCGTKCDFTDLALNTEYSTTNINRIVGRVLPTANNQMMHCAFTVHLYN